MKLQDFDVYKDLLMKKSGLVITQDKSYLLDSRLTPVAKKWNFANLDAMSVALRGIPDQGLVRDIVEAMTTNETSFFRDQKPFDQFKQTILPHMLKARASVRKVRVWCAASSSGQEPYSLSMLVKENQALMPGWSVEFLATDLSEDILAQARGGLYSQFEVQRGLPINLLMKYFRQEGEKWRISEDIRKMVKYETFNLLDPMTRLGKFDVIFCRNVLIYFDEPTKRRVLEGMAALLPPDGFLFLGGAETVFGITERFKPMENTRGVYILSGGAHDRAPASAVAQPVGR
ncbi:MAG: protein-glutamate O-methyltransferase [Rhodospirillales bacterium]|nr:protein-glutamate O-methyltransferase [Rhodospirillales bacterium]